MRRMPEQSTGPEIRVRQVLFKNGFRYRIKYPVPGVSRRSIDIALPGRRVAIFIDGCFWHGCAEHRSIPKHNHKWWKAKIDETRRRDRDTDQRLHAAGWLVLRYWEHEPAEQIVEDVRKAVIRRTMKKQSLGATTV
jgi:DNA mismatch endonuclease (patch repair protein)